MELQYGDIAPRIFALQKKGIKIHCRAKTFGIMQE
jgi:hypothetical protein